MTLREQHTTYNQYRGLVRYTIKRYKEILSPEDYEEMEADCLGEIFRAIEAYDPEHESGASIESLISKYVSVRACSFIRTMGCKRAIFNAGTVSLSTPINGGDGILEDIIPARHDNPDSHLQLSAAIASIQDPRCRDIVTRVAQGETMRSIGRDHKIGRQRVFQIKEAGVEEMSGNVGRKRTEWNE